MYTWNQYKSAESALIHIEETYAQLELFEKYYHPDNQEWHGLDQDDIEDVISQTEVALKSEISSLPGPVYYWLMPFYPGNFLTLIKAIKKLGKIDPELKTRKSAQSFYRFFMSLPYAEKVILGLNLESTELINRSNEVLQKIETRKQDLTDSINRHHSN